jgi:hypothetical protein
LTDKKRHRFDFSFRGNSDHDARELMVPLVVVTPQFPTYDFGADNRHQTTRQIKKIAPVWRMKDKFRYTNATNDLGQTGAKFIKEQLPAWKLE